MQAYKSQFIFFYLFCFLVFSLNLRGSKTRGARVISNPDGKSVTICETHQEVIHMTVERMLAKYGDNAPLVFTQHMFAEVNIQRRKLSLHLLTYDNTLEGMCYKWSDFMMQNKKLGHCIDGLCSTEGAGDAKAYKVMPENILMDNIKYVTIHEIIEIWLYFDDKNDALRGEKRDIDLNHKTPIISKDIRRFGCGYAIDNVSNTIYVTMRTGSLFSN
ncbi:MAG: CAP domain-containing protein [Candidatus Moranbacteria bacterium]|jgi:hypothetical protein|nr:CAP domain-containing protein [Candidatus Moranbacteria bacterium]